MKAVVAAFNQEKALVGAFSVITNLRMELFGALVVSNGGTGCSTAVLLVPEVLLGAGDDGHVAGPAVHLLHRRGRAHAHRRVQAGGRA